MKFSELIKEGRRESNLTKILGKPDNVGKIGQAKEYTWVFNDGSNIRVQDDISRIEYYTQGGEFVTSFTTVGQVKKYLEQSGILGESFNRDKHYKVKGEVIYTTKDNFKGAMKDYIGSDKKSYMALTDKGSMLLPVEFVTAKELEDMLTEGKIVNEATIKLDGIGKDRTFINQLKDTKTTFMIWDDNEIKFDIKFKKEVEKTLKDNGYSVKAINESSVSTQIKKVKAIIKKSVTMLYPEAFNVEKSSTDAGMGGIEYVKVTFNGKPRPNDIKEIERVKKALEKEFTVKYYNDTYVISVYIMNKKSINESELNEASPIDLGAVPQKIMVQLDNLKKILNGNFRIDINNLHDGIHGIITGVEVPGIQSDRYEPKQLVAMSKLKGVRWFEFEESYITIGWEH